MENKEILRRFKELHEIDEKIQKHIQTLVKGVLGLSDYPNGVKNIEFARSLSEGSVISRIFKNDCRFSDQLNHEIECDLEYTMVEVPKSLKMNFEDIPGKDGYVRVKLDYDAFQKVDRLGWDASSVVEKDVFSKITTNEGYLQPYQMKQEIMKHVQYHNPTKRYERLIAKVLEEDPVRVSITCNQEVNKASIGTEYFLEVDGQLHITFSYDIVTLIKICWWPEIANKWITRERNWPSRAFIDSIANVGYIIGKSSSDEAENDETIELRYSFAHIERKLVSMRSKHQHLIYLIFKAMSYKWLKPVDPNQISSFIGKTIMFWMCEKYPPEHKMWSDDFESTKCTIVKLFEEMKDAFEVGNLPYFFNEKVNVIERIFKPDMENVKNEIQARIERIVNDIMKYLPVDMKKEMNWSMKVLQYAEGGSNLINYFDKFRCIIGREDALSKAVSPATKIFDDIELD